jgi:NitT/TauT family transport system ATP-binding protein
MRATIVDVDPQGAVRYGLGLRPLAPYPGIADYLAGTHPLEAILHPTALPWLRVVLAGSVTAGGESARAARLAASAFMPQRDLLLPWRDALGNAALALECAGASRKAARRAAAPLFERFGLAEFERAYPTQLSGGMRQRVAFLRTLLAGRPLLLLDEPFASLDALTRAGMQEWLADALAAEPRTVVLVTHDVEEALYLADRVVVLSARPGRVTARIEVGLPRPRPRRATVTAPEFGELRERALEALGL